MQSFSTLLKKDLFSFLSSPWNIHPRSIFSSWHVILMHFEEDEEIVY